MELKCYINGVEYASNLVQGVTFSEEYNETLDSGTIIINGVHQLVDLKPYDDVFIYEGNFTGYPRTEEGFYKHLLVDSFTETLINIDERLYNYTIELFSETKKLETIQLPNVSITQPLDINKKRSVWDYLQQYVNLYSPLYKKQLNTIDDLLGLWVLKEQLIIPDNPTVINDVIITIDNSLYKSIGWGKNTEKSILIVKDATNQGVIIYDSINGWVKPEYRTLNISVANISEENKTLLTDFLTKNAVSFEPVGSDDKWFYVKKYKLDPKLQSIFGKVYSPDFTLNAPSLKDVLTQLMLVKDMIPYVKDDEIKGLDITERKRHIDLSTRQDKITNITSSMSSSNYANNLRRTYSNALSQEKSARRVEYLGFRNSEDALLTIDNMRLETSFPIYKINKIYLCYYKKGIVKDATTGLPVGNKQKIFLCKQDITKLVKLNSERALLSQDWNDFSSIADKPTSVDQLSLYKLCTVGYDIGGNTITGWGTKYNYPKGWWDITKTYLENIVTILDKNNPFGIYSYGYVANNGGLGDNEVFSVDGELENNLVTPFSNISLAMKSFVFQIDYDAFYNGAVVHSKDDDERDDITINDNSSSSLTLLEKDGLFQKEKLNRFGNRAIQINATYSDTSDMLELGDVVEDDTIIYHKEYQIKSNCVVANYYGTKDYVLKNYYVSVYAKHRTYNLMSYGESVNRAENRKMYIVMSKSKCYFEKENQKLNFDNFSDSYLRLLLSAFEESPRASAIDYFKTPNKINFGYVEYLSKKYFADVNAFVNGYSLCFNLKMYDNVSMGVYIDAENGGLEPVVDDSVKDDFTGSIQKWCITSDTITGAAKTLGFGVGHIDNEKQLFDKVVNFEEQIIGQAYPRLFRMPYLDEDNDILDLVPPNNIVSSKYDVYKDNKETIDMTMQFEPYTADRNVLFSQWLMKLSELLSSYNKVDVGYNQVDAGIYNNKAILRYISSQTPVLAVGNVPYYTPLMIFAIKKSAFDKIDKSKTNIAITNVIAEFPIGTVGSSVSGYHKPYYYSFEFKKMASVNNEQIVFNGTQKLKLYANIFQADRFTSDNVDITFKKIDSFGSNICPSDEYWFSNAYYFADSISPTALLFPENEISYTYGGKKYTVVPKDFGFRTDKFIVRDAIFNGLTVDTDILIAGSQENKDYRKNMYVVYSKEPLKKTLVYDELKSIPTDKTEKATDVFNVVTDTNGLPMIRVNLDNVSPDDKSVQYWFYDETSKSYKFVFGVNITEEEAVAASYTDIYLSLLSTKDTRVYDDKHLVIGHINNYAAKDNIKEYGQEQYFK